MAALMGKVKTLKKSRLLSSIFYTTSDKNFPLACGWPSFCKDAEKAKTTTPKVENIINK
jgi:peptide methionine sulfoxide reductase MsrB